MPSLVAESLRPAPDPLAAWLRPGPTAPASAVASGLARALLPPVAEMEPPTWLRADQCLSFQRVLAAVRRFGGALLADGVGTGKTYVSLAVAEALEPARAIHVIAPASLLTQWSEAGRRTGLSLRLHSHETLSRGRAPGAGRGVVIIDESHRFRTPTTRRYETLAPWLVGRCGLLLSATPAVNRLADVAHQLLLLVPDDALNWAGTPSLLEALTGAAASTLETPGALAHLVITGEDRSQFLPARSYREVAWSEPAGSPWEAMVEGLEALRLSRNPAVARLIRIALFQSLASSSAALALALRKYQSLLLHARDAGSSGTSLSRRMIRAISGAELDQLVLWPLLGSERVAETPPPPDLDMQDIERVRYLERLAREWCVNPDAKLEKLRSLVLDGRPTLVFTTLTATVRHLRLHLGPGVAWCTGAEAGLDRSRLPRDHVLDWFRGGTLPADTIVRRPAILVATDVASEGLDLPRVERVVHYDLPWTALRVEQRSGRAVRLGGLQREVEVIRFCPPPRIEAALAQERIIEIKSALPGALGLDSGDAAPWRLSARLASAWGGVCAAEGTATVPGPASAVVAGFRISARSVVLARVANRWTDDPATIARLLEHARGAGTPLSHAGRPSCQKAALRGLIPLIRKALRTAHGAGVAQGVKSPLARSALRRLMALARSSARLRAGRQMRQIEAGIRFVRRGHTAGELRLAEGWATIPERQLVAELASLPDIPTPQPIGTVVLIGMLLITR